MVLYGADRLTEGAASLARRMRVPEIVIGLTIVSAGTSAPELFVSLASALKGSSDMALGNVVGSNIMNVMLIVGCSAVVAPMTISRNTVRKDIPFAILASLVLLLLCANNVLGLIDGIVLLAVFAVFMWYTLSQAVSGKSEAEAQEQQVTPWLSVVYMIAGLALLVFGSNIFVAAASRVAESLGVSDAVIGLTIVAGGTSLPELATSVVAASKGQSALAIGNVIGSNVFNILCILGIVAVVKPMDIQGITTVDLSLMMGSVLLLWLFSRTRYLIQRWEGMVLLAGYCCYLAWLLFSVNLA